jgi:hypothetical protein
MLQQRHKLFLKNGRKGLAMRNYVQRQIILLPDHVWFKIGVGLSDIKKEVGKKIYF